MTVAKYRGPSEALDELERELNVRSRCFHRWIREGRVSKTDARDRLDRMASAHKMLMALTQAEPDTLIQTELERYYVDYSITPDVTSSGDKTA